MANYDLNVITSWPPEGWEQYARQFVSDFPENWPHTATLTCLVEVMPPEAALRMSRRVRFESIWKAIPYLNSMITQMQLQKHNRGIMQKPDGTEIYSYRHDAQRWVRKAMAYTEACKNIKGLVVWVDADSRWHTPMPPEFIPDMLGNVHHAYLGREHIPMYTETGFLAFNTNHKSNEGFCKFNELIWHTGSFVMLREWHDCETFDFVRRTLRIPGYNLSEGLPTIHPFINSVLGEYGDHMKGARKQAGISALKDLIVDRSDHPYWARLYKADTS